jgi:hypothetical protein
MLAFRQPHDLLVHSQGRQFCSDRSLVRAYTAREQHSFLRSFVLDGVSDPMIGVNNVIYRKVAVHSLDLEVNKRIRHALWLGL